MAKKSHREPHVIEEMERLKQRVAKQLGLEKDITKNGWKEMSTRDIGKIGGNMVKQMIEEYEKKIK